SMPEIKAGLQRCFRKSHERKGKPDIAGYHRRMGGISVFVEVKVGKDQLSPDQKFFLDGARRAGCIAIVARTEEQFISEWESEMQRITGRVV
ncbi:VRR-NUC domain-containing protein, partial [Arthrospira platensis SPKY1]|nr:VRR-NUC domain-containing protein [Arthrospira platensis SPKY1]